MSGRIETRDAFLAAAGLGTAEVDLPNGGKVTVREMSVVQRAEFRRLAGDGDPGMLSAFVAATCCVDANGNRIFTSPDDLEGVSPRAVDAISRAVMKISGAEAKDDTSGEA